MLLITLILVTSFAGFLGTWYATGGFEPGGGNPVASVLVALAIALIWSRGVESLERHYRSGKFDVVRRRLSLWGGAMGVVETILIRLWMDVESRNTDAVSEAVEATGELGLTAFAKSWAAALAARLENQPEKALAFYDAGVQATGGLDRAELLCEAGVLLLQMASLDEPAARDEKLAQALSRSTAANMLLWQGAKGAGGRTRLQYVEALHQLLRGLILVAQCRHKDASARFGSVRSRVRMASSLRARRLGLAAAIEQLVPLRHTAGQDQYDRALSELQRSVALPGLRLRLAEIRQAEVRERERTFAAAERAAQIAALSASRSGSNSNGLASASGAPGISDDDILRPEDIMRRAAEAEAREKAARPERGRRSRTRDPEQLFIVLPETQGDAGDDATDGGTHA